MKRALSRRTCSSVSILKSRKERWIRGKRVDWITYNFEEGELYIAVRFMDKTAFHIQFRPYIVINGVELSDWKTGDD